MATTPTADDITTCIAAFLKEEYGLEVTVRDGTTDHVYIRLSGGYIVNISVAGRLGRS